MAGFQVYQYETRTIERNPCHIVWNIVPYSICTVSKPPLLYVHACAWCNPHKASRNRSKEIVLNYHISHWTLLNISMSGFSLQLYAMYVYVLVISTVEQNRFRSTSLLWGWIYCSIVKFGDIGNLQQFQKEHCAALEFTTACSFCFYRIWQEWFPQQQNCAMTKLQFISFNSTLVI